MYTGLWCICTVHTCCQCQAWLVNDFPNTKKYIAFLCDWHGFWWAAILKSWHGTGNGNWPACSRTLTIHEEFVFCIINATIWHALCHNITCLGTELPFSFGLNLLRFFLSRLLFSSTWITIVPCSGDKLNFHLLPYFSHPIIWTAKSVRKSKSQYHRKRREA